MAKPDHTPMTESEIAALAGQEIVSAVGYLDGTIARERAQALKYYRGDKFGNEVDGRSKVVSRDLMETVEWIMPSLMRVFVSGDTIVRFQPDGPEDEDVAEQKTDYVNHVLFKDNNAFAIFYTWFKDALLQKNGIVKTFWDETSETRRTRHTGLTEDQLALILADDESAEVTEQDEYLEQLPPMIGPGGEQIEVPPITLYDVTIERTHEIKKIIVEPIPPEEFIISREARSMSDARMVGHRSKKTVTEYLEMGFDEEQLISLSENGANFGLANTEYVERRHQEYEYPRTGSAFDNATRDVIIVEAFMKMDIDGDGYAELVRVFVGGTTHELMKWADGTPAVEKWDEISPFSDVTPIIMPHVFFGMSMYDIVADLQLIRSTVLRQILDNQYSMNNNRTGILEGKVNLDDYLTNRVGGVVRVKGVESVSQALMPLPVQPIVQHALPLMEQLEQMKEQRTGVIRNQQGLDPDTLTNHTATGITRLMNAADQRVELIARVFAETGVKDVFRKILELSVEHQDRARQIKVKGRWVEMDPRSWVVTDNMTAEVGLGFDTREQDMLSSQLILDLQKTAVEMQGGVEGPFVTAPKIYNALESQVKASGKRHVEMYFEDPSSPAMQQIMEQKKAEAPQQDAGMALAQGQLANEKAKMDQDGQVKADQHKLDMDKLQADNEQFDAKLATEERLKLAEIQSRENIEVAKIQAKQSEMSAKMSAETTSQAIEIQANSVLEREKMAASMAETAAKIQADDAKAAEKLRADAETARLKADADVFNKELDREEQRQAREEARADKQISITRNEETGELSGTVTTNGAD